MIGGGLFGGAATRTAVGGGVVGRDRRGGSKGTDVAVCVGRECFKGVKDFGVASVGAQGI